MWKKILVSFFICSALLAIGSVSFATGEINNIDKNNIKTEIAIEVNKKETQTSETAEVKDQVDISKYQITSPENNAYTSKEKIALINGKAPSGTSILIKVYGTTDLTRKAFNLHKLPTEEDYIEIYKEEIEVGNLGFFDKQLELVTGINKIVINFNVKGVPSQEIIILVEPRPIRPTRPTARPTARPTREVRLTDMMTLIK